MHEAGHHIVLREVLGERAWATYAAVSVRDDAEWIASYIPDGSPIMAPVTDVRSYDRLADADDIRWERRAWHTTNALLLARPGEPWTVRLYWSAADWQFLCWYVNLERPLQRVRDGFETLDHELDIVVQPDHSYEWKDEDALQQWIDGGAFTEDDGVRFRRDGEAALERLADREAPFDGSWNDWRPDSAWTIPTMPDDWHGGRPH